MFVFMMSQAQPAYRYRFIRFHKVTYQKIKRFHKVKFIVFLVGYNKLRGTLAQGSNPSSSLWEETKVPLSREALCKTKFIDM